MVKHEPILKPLRIALINVPLYGFDQRKKQECVPPIWLLNVAGVLIDDGHVVALFDANQERITLSSSGKKIKDFCPDVLIFGDIHSHEAHKNVDVYSRVLRHFLPSVKIIYGGVFPSFHWREILKNAPQIDIVVRGEAEETIRKLMVSLSFGISIDSLAGIIFKSDDKVIKTGAASAIKNLDIYRTAWELIDFEKYRSRNGKISIDMEFSRGGSYQDVSLKQDHFSAKWKSRSVECVVSEIAWLHHERGVDVISLIDFFPNASPIIWFHLLQCLVQKDLQVVLKIKTNSQSLIRDQRLLNLYKNAGIECVSLELVNPELESPLTSSKKTFSNAKRAISLLKEHRICSLVYWVIGSSEETDRDLWRAFRHLCDYAPDYVRLKHQLPYHSLSFIETFKSRLILQNDFEYWDGESQVLTNANIPTWRIFIWRMMIEAFMQYRWKSIRRLLIAKKFGWWVEPLEKGRWLREIYRNFSLLTKRVFSLSMMDVLATPFYDAQSFVLPEDSIPLIFSKREKILS